MKYLFDNKELIFLMIDHLNRRSISEALHKVLNSNNTDFEDADIKIEIYNRILDKFDGSDLEVL
jgi:hypothetical protein